MFVGLFLSLVSRFVLTPLYDYDCIGLKKVGRDPGYFFFSFLFLSSHVTEAINIKDLFLFFFFFSYVSGLGPEFIKKGNPSIKVWVLGAWFWGSRTGNVVLLFPIKACAEARGKGGPSPVA